jgi:hypothetical protein
MTFHLVTCDRTILSYIGPKLKNCLFPAPDWPLENIATRNIFLRDLWCLFFFYGYRISWPKVPILFQNFRSELVYTFKWTKSVARLWRNQICEWKQFILKKKKISLYLPTHRWNGGSGAGNEHIFKGGLATSKSNAVKLNKYQSSHPLVRRTGQVKLYSDKWKLLIEFVWIL